MLKDNVLRELKAGGTVSGEKIAEKYGVTRCAVWKAVNRLKSDGYQITGSTKTGYVLMKSDVLSAEEIGDALDRYAQKKGFNVRKRALSIIYLPSCDSTNNEARRLAGSGLTLIAAEEQTAGRGRVGRQFLSEHGAGAYFSLLIPWGKEAESSLRLTSLAAVAVVKAAEELTGKKPLIKWVNDVLLNGKKICGILTEGVVDMESGTSSDVIIGIGVNLNAELKDLPFAGNLGWVPRATLIGAVAAEILEEVPYISQNRHIEFYRSHSCLLGKRIYFIKNGEKREGVAVNIGDGGELIVDCGGEVVTLSSGEVTVREIQ